MNKNSGNFSAEDVKKFAQSDAGRQLMALLQQKDSDAVRQAQAGNYEEALTRLSGILDSPEAKQLLKNLGR